MSVPLPLADFLADFLAEFLTEFLTDLAEFLTEFLTDLAELLTTERLFVRLLPLPSIYDDIILCGNETRSFFFYIQKILDVAPVLVYYRLERMSVTILEIGTH